MSNNRIRVPGYARRTTYLGDIEYRNFSPDLVGFQLASDGGTPLFTLGNFSITTNLEPKRSKVFATTSFSNFVSLTDLDLTLQQAYALLQDNAGVILNLDKRRLSNYVLFSSFKEYVRVALENIIINWPAALYASPIYSLPPTYITISGFTFENYSYDRLTEESTFKTNVNVLANQYQINFLRNGTLGGTFNENNQLRNLTVEYESYSIMLNDTEYNILGFTGSTYTNNDYIYFKVKGNPFSGNTSGYNIFYIKPNKKEENLFFNSLPDFEYYLLNRLVVPRYTATFNFTVRTDAGPIIHTQDSVTWPTTDGYNLDFDTDAYEEYASRLLEISDNFDLSTSNLMVRFLVTESITSFDTAPIHLSDVDQDTSEQKVNKTLVVYGREYDDINQYITGIKFANTVSYDKQDNTPDVYLKDIAKVMGWQLISSVLEQNLLKSYIQPRQSTYQGQSVGLTAVEADIELWRRIILNTPWLWKSKGTRKAIEFLFKFIGTPLGLIEFNEYIYVAEDKLDYNEFLIQLNRNNIPTNTALTRFPIDIDGYPNPLPDTSDLYFQGLGLWYRETGGYNSSIDINAGNNPHLGPYDGGYKYINQFRKLIPNYSAVTISSQTTTTNTDNIFLNYNSGTITGYSGRTYVDITTKDGADFSNCYVVNAEVILDPKNRQDQTNCGCDIPENLKSLSICIDRNEGKKYDCNKDIASYTLTNTNNLYYEYQYIQYNIDGSMYTINNVPQYYQSIFVDPKCCKGKSASSIPYNEVDSTGTLINSGFICCEASGATTNIDCGCFVTCKWTIDNNIRKVELSAGTGIYYLVFKNELDLNRLASYNGCNCVKDYTIPITITDPYTNQTGKACQLTPQGLTDIAKLSGDSIIIQTYASRSTGKIACNQNYTVQVLPVPSKIIAVVLNNSNQIGKRVNNLRFGEVSNRLFGGDYQNFNTPLTANTNGIGYLYGYIPRTVNYNTTVEMSVYSGITASVPTPVDIAFDPKLGHKMYYLQTNVEYNSSTFGSQLNNLIQLNTSARTITQAIGEFYSKYPFNFIGNPMYTYMVWDIRSSQQPAPQQVSMYCYTIANRSGKDQIFYWNDINNIVNTETISANTIINRCAKFNSVIGASLDITGGLNTCTNHNDCNITVVRPLFTIVNQTNCVVNNVNTNNVILPYATFPNYPVTQNSTVSGLRNVGISGRITLNLNLNETIMIELLVNNVLIQTKVETLRSQTPVQNYITSFNQTSIDRNDVITINLKRIVLAP